MSDEMKPLAGELASEQVGRDERRKGIARWRHAAQIALAVQVRLRFVVVLGVAFLVVGMWGNLRNVWDTWRHRLGGSHAGQQAVSIDTEYFCPMCPGVISDWPAICPVCSMDLVRRKKGEAALLPEGVVARMQLSPYRIQLAGIATAVVDSRPLARDVTVAGRLVELAMESSTGHRGSDLSPTSTDRPSTKLVLECTVPIGDSLLLAPGRPAQVMLDDVGGAAVLAGHVEPTQPAADAAPGRRNAIVRIRLADSAPWLRPGMYGTARIAVPLSEVEPFVSLRNASKQGSAAGFTSVPETAVVDTGSRRVVFVETMPGMFDGVEVTLGPRCGDYYPVIKGLEPGQKVATVGAFLIDAEARLSPDLAAAYFGAARTAAPADANGSGSAAAAQQPVTKRSKKAGAVKISAADQALIKKQKVCPVTNADLDSMGGPVAVEVAG
ncbi:MAG TPA: heavy metal-binding domain-containing protein, partial [Planctomycetaceae bacterium]